MAVIAPAAVELLPSPTNEDSAYDIEDLLFKVLVIGDYGVGKTAIIRRYTEGVFAPNYKITIGVDFTVKNLEWNKNTHVTLQLWDIAGHERFGYMTRVYYKYATAAIIVYDLARPATFESVVKWKEDLRSKVSGPNGQPVPVVLLANKCDLSGVTFSVDFLTKFCQQHGILAWFYTSAKENINLEEAIHTLVDFIISMKTYASYGPYQERYIGNSISKPFKLTAKPPHKKYKCCGGSGG